MKEPSYTTGLLLGACVLLLVGLVLTWTELLAYSKAGQPPRRAAVQPAPAPEETTEELEAEGTTSPEEPEEAP